MSVPDPLEARLSFFTGKGGVGKSTVVAALALEARRRRRRPLVVELGHRASMQAVFGVPDVGHAPREVAPGVFATNIDLDEALRDYVADHVPVRALASRIAKSPSLARFFEAAPAVGEVLTLQRLEQLLAEVDEAGRPRFDPILVDFDATGHALMFLELPRVFEGLVTSGPIRRLLDGFAALLSDDERTRLHLVTLPGRLPVQETLELYERIRTEHAVRLGALFVNRVPAPPLPPDAADLLAPLRARIAPDTPAGRDLALLALEHERYRRLRAQIARLEAVALPRVELPLVRGAVGVEALAELGRIARGAA
ncbi:MAG TPA: ArsA-related P-loop ATPase [Sandaracinaceae bacterium LLY-WYZ-13_1]|nr:ArsA-related P-loop ATPase [Sandaracinaceae bacterium LLY-WYZ-13_1]